MNRAPLFLRFCALLIDMVIVIFFSTLIWLATLLGYRLGAGRLTFPGLSIILSLSPFFFSFTFFFYFTYLTMEQGMTIGKSITGIRVVRKEPDGLQGTIGPLRAFVRTAAYTLSASVCFLGFLMALACRGETLHDLIAGTRVVAAHDKEES